MRSTSARFAINPLQWVASPDGWLDPTLAPPLAARLSAIRAAGFEGVHTDVPADLTPAAYATILADHGLHPAPGYLSVRLTDDDGERKQLAQRAARLGAQHAELGVPTLFLAMGMSRDAPRVAHPAVGFEFDPHRLERVRDLLAEMAEMVGKEGITPAFHPHVGTWAETEAEARFILDTVDASVLGFGPDMGHLGWAGADVVQLVRDYADRITSVHVKDYDTNLAERATRSGWDYRKTVLAGLWREPGHGSADVDGFVTALSDHFTGWLVVEVDRGSRATPEESVSLCGQWATGLSRRGNTR